MYNKNLSLELDHFRKLERSEMSFVKLSTISKFKRKYTFLYQFQGMLSYFFQISLNLFIKKVGIFKLFLFYVRFY